MGSGFTGIGKKILTLFLLAALASGCSLLHRKSSEVIDENFYFQRGMKYMGKKDYLKATTDFKTIVESYSGTAIVDHAQFMLAETHFLCEEFISSAYEYERVYVDYPSSPFAPEAHYKKALSYFMESPKAILDQENTLLAINEFDRFIDNYPANSLVKEAQGKIEELTSKLAYKEYLNAESYKKLAKQYEGALDAALFYYRYVINEYPRTVWVDYSRYGIGEVYFKKKEYEKAKEMFLLIINADVDAELKKKASQMIEDMKKLEAK